MTEISETWLRSTRTQLKYLLDVLDHHDQPLIAAHLATVIQCLDTQPNNAPRPPATDDANVSLPPLMEPGSFNAANPLIAKLSRVMTLTREDRAAPLFRRCARTCVKPVHAAISFATAIALTASTSFSVDGRAGTKS